jgi:hypothetical protein
MTLLSILTIVLIVPAFIGGWFGGYKKACDAHGWNLPGIDWNRARGTHEPWRTSAPLNLFLTSFPLAAAFPRRDCQKIPFGRINTRADNSERQWQAGALAKSYQCAWGTHGLIRLIRRT